MILGAFGPQVLYGLRWILMWAANNLVLGFLLFVPVLLISLPSFTVHDSARVAQMVLFAACSIALAWRVLTTSQATPHAKAGWVLLALGAVACAMADQPQQAAREATVVWGMVAVAWVVADGGGAALPRVTAVATAIYGVAILGIALTVMLSGQTLMLDEIFAGYTSYRFFNHAQTVAIPLVAVCAVADSRRLVRWLAWSALALSFSLVTLSAARATTVGLSVAVALALMLFRGRAFLVVRAIVFGAAAGLLIWLLVFRWIPNALDLGAQTGERQFGESGSAYARFYLWRLALDNVREAPWFGIGPMHFAHRPNGEAAHPHNIYLQVAAEWGLPMLAVLSVGCVWWLRQLGQAVLKARTHADLGVGMFVACVAALADGVFSGNFVMPVSQVWIAATAGASVGFVRRVHGAVEVTSAGGMALRRSAMVALLAAQVWLFATVSHEVISLDERLEQLQRVFPSKTQNPRFWSHGWF